MADDRTLVAGLGRPRRRLNPFAFPAETNVRFALMVVAALTFAFMMGWTIVFEFVLPEGELEIVEVDASQPDEVFYGAEAQADARRQIGQVVLVVCFPIGALFLLVGLSYVIYRRHPARLRRRINLQPVSPPSAPGMYQMLGDLSQVAGIAPPPALEVSKGSRTVDGQAFGFRKRPIIRVGGRMSLAVRKAPELFRAVMLHELAHIANRDIGRTYFAQALWAAVIAVVFVPAALAFVFLITRGVVLDLLDFGIAGFDFAELLTVKIPAFVFSILQLVATVAVVAAIRSSLLRVREMYADWRAAQWGAEASLMDILRQNASGESVGGWSRIWRLHPPAADRLEVLRDSRRLFQIAQDMALFTGILLAMMLEGLSSAMLVGATAILGGTRYISFFIGVRGFEQESDVLSVLLFRLGISIYIVASILLVLVLIALVVGALYLLAGTVGLQVQRQALVEMTEGRRGMTAYLRLIVPTLLVIIGIEFGFLITPLGFFRPRTLAHFLGLTLWWVAMFGFLWFSLAFARFFSIRWLGAQASDQPPSGRRRLLTLAQTVMLGGIFSAGLLVRAEVIGQLFSGVGIPVWQAVVWPLTWALATFITIFLGTALIVTLTRRRPVCPTCAQPTHHRHAVGEQCEHCGTELALWLYADPPTSPSHTDATLAGGA